MPPPEGRDAAAARDLAISEAQEKVDSYMAHDSYTGVVDAIDAEVNSGTAQLGRLAQPLQRTPGPRASRPPPSLVQPPVATARVEFLPRSHSQPTEGIQNRDAFGSTAVAYYRAHAHAAHHHHDARHAQRLRTTQQHTANSTRDTHCALASVAAALSQIRRKTYVRRSSCGPPHAHKLDKAAVVPQLSHSLTQRLAAAAPAALALIAASSAARAQRRWRQT